MQPTFWRTVLVRFLVGHNVLNSHNLKKFNLAPVLKGFSPWFSGSKVETPWRRHVLEQSYLVHGRQAQCKRGRGKGTDQPQGPASMTHLDVSSNNPLGGSQVSQADTIKLNLHKGVLHIIIKF